MFEPFDEEHLEADLFGGMYASVMVAILKNLLTGPSGDVMAYSTPDERIAYILEEYRQAREAEQ